MFYYQRSLLSPPSSLPRLLCYLIWHRSSLYPGRLARLTECHLAKSVSRLAGDCEGRIVVGWESPHHGLLAGEGRHLSSPQLGGLLLAALLTALTGRASLLEDKEVRRPDWAWVVVTWQIMLERENSSWRVWSLGRTRKRVTLKLSWNFPDLSLAAWNRERGDGDCRNASLAHLVNLILVQSYRHQPPCWDVSFRSCM